MQYSTVGHDASAIMVIMVVMVIKMMAGVVRLWLMAV